MTSGEGVGDRPSGSRPSATHERRRGELKSLAQLLGFDVPTVLADGSIPDVLLANTRDRALFIGDAKQSEEPTDRATAGRLLGYLEWLRAPPSRSPHVFAIAHAPGRDADWDTLVSDLAVEAELTVDPPQAKRLSRRTVVTLMYVHGGKSV